MLKLLPEAGVWQWTLTGMVLKEPLPLTSYLDDGAPAAAFENPAWPRELRSPSKRGVGFVHQGSQWRGHRYQQVISTIKESCLRAYRSGLEGVSIHGEVSCRHIPNALNYLAFSHFTHWPEDTMRDFGRKTLGQVLGSAEHGEAYVEVLAHWDAGTLTKDACEPGGSRALRLPGPRRRLCLQLGGGVSALPILAVAPANGQREARPELHHTVPGLRLSGQRAAPRTCPRQQARLVIRA